MTRSRSIVGAGTPRGRGRRARAVGARAVVAPTSLSTPFGLVGLCATMLAIPLAVHGSAAGPFDDPKAWALPILVALTGLGWLIDRREDFGPGLFPFADRATRWMAGTVGAYALWWVVTALVAVGPVQSVFGNFGRGLGLVAFGSAILLFPLVGA